MQHGIYYQHNYIMVACSAQDKKPNSTSTNLKPLNLQPPNTNKLIMFGRKPSSYNIDDNRFGGVRSTDEFILCSFLFVSNLSSPRKQLSRCSRSNNAFRTNEVPFGVTFLRKFIQRSKISKFVVQC